MATTYKELMEAARATVPEATPEEVQQRLKAEKGITLIDVREREEFRQGYLDGALSLPRGFLELQVEDRVPDHEGPIIAYCAGGTRSLIAAKTLKEMGYENVTSMSGGFNGWKNAGLPFEKDRELTPEQAIRYSRHFLLPEVGEKGQGKLLDARVLCIGAGGLGSPTAFYLAAAGVGTIGLVDHDVVDLSNLQRQILHTNDRVGMLKVESAQKTLNALNPDVRVVGHAVRLSAENVREIFADYDIVVNGCDNFPTRYLINDACYFMGKPLVDGSIFQFEGQATVFLPGGDGPCYRCLYPEPPPPGMAPSCAEAGVLGVLPGLVGSVQALEVIKLILGAGESLCGRMMQLDTLKMQVRNFNLRKNPDCVLCGTNPSVTDLIDYEGFCAGA